MLAVIAMLADRSLEQVRADARKIVGKPRHRVSHSTYWETVDTLRRRYHVTGVPTNHEWHKHVRSGDKKIPRSSLKLTDRGSLVISCPASRNTHIVAYKHGRVYDPSVGEFALSTWLKKYSHEHILSVHPEKRRKK